MQQTAEQTDDRLQGIGSQCGCFPHGLQFVDRFQVDRGSRHLNKERGQAQVICETWGMHERVEERVEELAQRVILGRHR